MLLFYFDSHVLNINSKHTYLASFKQNIAGATTTTTTRKKKENSSNLSYHKPITNLLRSIRIMFNARLSNFFNCNSVYSSHTKKEQQGMKKKQQQNSKSYIIFS